MDDILIVEDDQALSQGIRLGLEGEGRRFVQASTLAHGERALEERVFSLVVLDLNLPDGSGLELLRRLRTHSALPVLILTANDLELDQVTGLELGAEDYIVKPFEVLELLARVEGLLRHTGRRAATLQAFDAVIDPDNHIVTQNGTRVELTPREFDLLLALVRARGQLLYREALYERVWGLDSNAGPRTVDIHIHRLRKKLHWDHKIVTVPKVGYKLLP